MGCQCYQIGGPFIAEDPDCPAHGTEAQDRKRELEEQQYNTEVRLSRLEKENEELKRKIKDLEERYGCCPD